MNAMQRACTAVSLPVRLVSVMLLLAGTAVAGDAMATTYRVVPLQLPAGTKLTGYTDPGAMDINVTGDVVGTVLDSNAGRTYAVEWSPPDYAMHILPAEGASSTRVTNIGDAGDILGVLNFPDASYVNVMWKSNGSYVQLANTTPGGWGHNPGPYDVNIHGVAVGSDSSSPGKPAVWTTPQTLRLLIRAPRDSYATAVNDSGMIVGCPIPTTHPHLHGFRWTPGVGVQELDDLPDGDDHDCANDVNNSGQIVGFGSSAIGKRAVLWDADGTSHDLGDLPGATSDTEYWANRVNNFGDVVGSTITSPTSVYWIWTSGTGMLPIDSLIDPNDPLHGAGTFYVYDINDAGVLVAALYQGTNSPPPVVLIPQP